MGSKSQQYLRNVAVHICGQIGGVDVATIDVHVNDDEFPTKFWSAYGKKIVSHLKAFGPEARGRIVAAATFEVGKFSHFDMAKGVNLNCMWSADDILRLLTGYVVGAEICSSVRRSVREQEAFDEAQEYLLDQAMHGPGPLRMREGRVVTRDTASR